MAEHEDDDLRWPDVERRRTPPPHELYRYIDEHLTRNAEQRFKVRTFADLQALLTIGVVMLGGIAWGLKLEARLEAEAKAREALTAAVARGILPVAEERLASLTARLDRREAEATQAMEVVHEVQRDCMELRDKLGARR